MPFIVLSSVGSIRFAGGDFVGFHRHQVQDGENFYVALEGKWRGMMAEVISTADSARCRLLADSGQQAG
jgi:hypothetical protein